MKGSIKGAGGLDATASPSPSAHAVLASTHGRRDNCRRGRMLGVRAVDGDEGDTVRAEYVGVLWIFLPRTCPYECTSTQSGVHHPLKQNTQQTNHAWVHAHRLVCRPPSTRAAAANDRSEPVPYCVHLSAYLPVTASLSHVVQIPLCRIVQQRLSFFQRSNDRQRRQRRDSIDAVNR